MTLTSTKPRSLSGIKPTGTGNPHLGNYLGMIQPALDLQERYEAFYFVADYHALTSLRDAEMMRHSTKVITAYFLAFGLDPDRGAFFRQSDLPEVTELTWMLSCVTPMGRLERAHSYKDAVAKGIAGELNHGVFSYPVLMAADILLYDSEVVPVGADQIQHLEMARDMASKFNLAFGGDYLKLPEARVREEVAVVPGVDGRKMSKSYGNTIEPLSSPKRMRKQVMKIETSSTPMTEPMDPTTCTAFALYALFASEQEKQEMAANYARSDFGYGHAKQALFEKMEQRFAPYRERFEALMADDAYLEDVLRGGAKRARPVAEEVIARVREAVGLPSRPFGS